MNNKIKPHLNYNTLNGFWKSLSNNVSRKTIYLEDNCFNKTIKFFI